jgi:hypothetical protein
MSPAEATAWWTEVEEVRERIERRRAPKAEAPARESRRVAPAVAQPRRALSPVAADPFEGPEPAEWTDGSRPAAASSEGRAQSAPQLEGARRTVRIRGQAIPTVVAPRLRPADAPYDFADVDGSARAAGVSRARPARPRPRPAERLGPNPDRLAAWAFALALLTLLVAAISAHGL